MTPPANELPTQDPTDLAAIGDGDSAGHALCYALEPWCRLCRIHTWT
jgi:hypothetical protein